MHYLMLINVFSLPLGCAFKLRSYSTSYSGFYMLYLQACAMGFHSRSVFQTVSAYMRNDCPGIISPWQRETLIFRPCKHAQWCRSLALRALAY
ncbi:hypothetical protein FKM82_021963 [Ascaphus truei]